MLHYAKKCGGSPISSVTSGISRKNKNEFYTGENLKNNIVPVKDNHILDFISMLCCGCEFLKLLHSLWINLRDQSFFQALQVRQTPHWWALLSLKQLPAVGTTRLDAKTLHFKDTFLLKGLNMQVCDMYNQKWI